MEKIFSEAKASVTGAKAGSSENSIALRVAEQYARNVILNPDDHLDAVESTITDFMAGVEWSKNNISINNKKILKWKKNYYLSMLLRWMQRHVQK
jgi:hypothetical protein